MQCVILVGGLGTRLGNLADGKPKPLLEVSGETFLRSLLRQAITNGMDRVLLLAGHKADQIEQFVSLVKPDFPQIRIEVSIESSPLGTAGAIVHAKSKLEDVFLLLNGDSIFDFNWLDLAEIYLNYPNANIVMSLRYEPDTSRYGIVELDGRQVAAFHERGSSSGGLINGGVYFISRSTVDLMPIKGSLERDVLPVLARDKRLAGKVYEGFFIDIGTPESLVYARKMNR